jgi:nicotinamidase-related amidase
MESTQFALILVDVQHDFWAPLRDAPEHAAFPANVRALLAAARANRLSVVHTHAEFNPDGSDWMLFYGPGKRGDIPCIAGTPGAAVEEFAQAHPGEPVIRKRTFDGFAYTDLETVLRERGIQAVLVAGLVTSVCVLFTTTSAYLRRFVPIVVSDACADWPGCHEAALRMYTGLCFQSVKTAEVQADLAGVLRLAGRFLDEGG